MPVVVFRLNPTLSDDNFVAVVVAVIAAVLVGVVVGGVVRVVITWFVRRYQVLSQFTSFFAMVERQAVVEGTVVTRKVMAPTWKKPQLLVFVIPTLPFPSFIFVETKAQRM